jgi:hypothetical protein
MSMGTCHEIMIGIGPYPIRMETGSDFKADSGESNATVQTA